MQAAFQFLQLLVATLGLVLLALVLGVIILAIAAAVVIEISDRIRARLKKRTDDEEDTHDIQEYIA